MWILSGAEKSENRRNFLKNLDFLTFFYITASISKCCGLELRSLSEMIHSILESSCHLLFKIIRNFDENCNFILVNEETKKWKISFFQKVPLQKIHFLKNMKNNFGQFFSLPSWIPYLKLLLNKFWLNHLHINYNLIWSWPIYYINLPKSHFGPKSGVLKINFRVSFHPCHPNIHWFWCKRDVMDQ